MTGIAPIRAVSRSLDALKAINRHGRMTVGDIAKEIDLPYVTACRIVQTLVVEGLIVREPAQNHYRPTAQVRHLVAGFDPEDDLVRAARPVLADFTRATGWPVSVSIPIAGEMMMRAGTHSSAILLNERCFPGFSQPILRSVPGRLMLSTVSSRVRAHDHLAEEGNGYGLAPKATSSVAVPVFGRAHLAEAALTMTFATRDLRLERALELHLPCLREAAAAIGQGLWEASGRKRAANA